MSVLDLLTRIESTSSSLVPSRIISEGTPKGHDTQKGSPGSLSSLPKIQKTKINKNLLYELVQQASSHFEIPPQFIIDHYFSIDDEYDIVSGEVPRDTLGLFIEVWIKDGMPHISDKDLDKESTND